MKTLPIADRLPKRYLAAIGEVVTVWARLEIELRALTFTVLGIGVKQGRTAVRTPRAKEMVQMIEELMQIEGLSIRHIDPEKFQTFLEQVEIRRNLVAHALWLKGPKRTYVIQNLQGSWPKENGQRVRKRIDPEGVAVTPDHLAGLVENIREAIQLTRLLGQDVQEQLAASHRKRRAQDQSGSPHPQRKASPEPRPTPLQE